MAGMFDWLFGKKTDALYDAMHDKKTGLYNNNGFQMLYRDADQGHSAVIIIELMDCQNMPYKMIEKDMKMLANAVKKEFRSVDHICRIKTDEIAVIMARMDSGKREVLEEKIARLIDAAKPDSLTVGIAFGDRENPNGDLFHDAVSALNRARIQGRDSCVIY